MYFQPFRKKRVVLGDYVTFPNLKIEIENLKGQITQLTKTPIVTSIKCNCR